MARVRLTKTLVDDLHAPEKGQAFVWDSEVPGFAVRATPSGAKAWIVQMRVRGGKERRMTIGFCNKVPLDRARQEARKVLGPCRKVGGSGRRSCDASAHRCREKAVWRQGHG